MVLKQSYSGHVKAATILDVGCRATGYICRIVVIVDEDIDPSNISEVLWALGTRVEPETSIDIMHGCSGVASDAMISLEKKALGNYETLRAIILACKPYYWMKEFPPSIEIETELSKRIKERWKLPEGMRVNVRR